MWVIFSGRLHEEVKQAIQEHLDIEIDSYDILEDRDYDIDKDRLQGIIILDAGLNSICEWKSVRIFTDKYKHVPIYLYMRDISMIPEKGVFDEHVKVVATDSIIYINNLVKDIKGVSGE